MGKAILIILAILVPVVGLWWFLKHRQPVMGYGQSMTAQPPHPNPAANNGAALENLIGKATGVPVGPIGKLASSSPEALKIMMAPVALTSVAHNLITHPKAELKSIAKDTVSTTKSVLKAPVKLVTHPITSVKNAGKSVKNAAKSVVHSITSIF